MPPNNTVLLQNNTTGALESRPLETYQKDIASGEYSETEQSKVRTNRLGAPVVSNPSEGQIAIEGGERPSTNIEATNKAIKQKQRDYYDTTEDKIATFAEGINDAATLGLLKDTSPGGEIRRDVNSGYAFAGNLVGTFTGAPSAVLGAGKSVGRKLAQTALGNIEGSGIKQVLARGAEEAAAGAALMGAQGIGSQVSDVVFDDKPFVGTAVLHDMKLGALLGGGLGLLGGGAGEYLKLKRAARGDIMAQGGLLDPTSAPSLRLNSQMSDALGHLDEVVNQHEMKLGIMEVVGKESGLVPKRFINGENSKLASNARAAGDKLKSMDIERALSGDDLAYSRQWTDAMEDYQGKVVKLDAGMSAMPWEKPANMGKPRFGPQGEGNFRNPTQIGLENNLAEGVASEGSVGLHAEMQGDLPKDYVGKTLPEGMEAPPATRMGEYQKIYGRPYEAPGELQQLDQGFQNLDQNLSTPSTEAKTGAMKAQPEPGPLLPNDLTGQAFIESLQEPTLSKLPTAERPVSEMAATEVQKRGNLDDLNAFADKLNEGTKNPAGLKPEYDQLRSQGRENAKQAVRDYIDKWYAETAANGPRPLKPTPADVAASKISGIMDDIRAATGSRLDSAAAVDIFKAEGVRPASTSLGGMVDQIVAARRIARAVADESRGVASPLRSSARERILGTTGRHIGRKITAAVAGGMVGGPAGAILGYAFADKLFGTAGRMAGSAGRLQNTIATTVDGLLSNSKGIKVASAAKNAFTNNPVAYSDAGPIKEPVDRIQEVRRVAANPDVLKQYIQNQLGDLGHLHPDIAGQIADQGAQQVIQLSIRAPRIAWDNLGNPIQPAANELRRWLSFENATHDVLGLLHSVQNNTANEQQMDALKIQHAPIAQRLVAGLLGDHEALKNASRATLRTASQLVGVQFSISGDPAFIARQQASWAVHGEPNHSSGGGVTPPPQTPADASARAPGN